MAAGAVSRGLPFEGGGLLRGGWLAGWLWRGAGGYGMCRGRVCAEGICANGEPGRRKQPAGMAGIGAGAGEGWVQVRVGGWAGLKQEFPSVTEGRQPRARRPGRRETSPRWAPRSRPAQPAQLPRHKRAGSPETLKPKSRARTRVKAHKVVMDHDPGGRVGGWVGSESNSKL